MLRIDNRNIQIEINQSNGLICGLYSFDGKYNFADRNGLGGICYTLKGEDIATEASWQAYAEREAFYDKAYAEENVVRCRNEEYGIETTYIVNEDSLILESHTEDSRLSQFGLNLNLNFMGKKNGTCFGQLLPSSPYTSEDGEKMYCIMPIVECGYMIAVAKTPCKAWKIGYSEYSYGHFIQNFQFLSALDERYDVDDNANVCVELTFADTIAECYQKIQKTYGCPMVYSEVTGTFGTHLDMKILGDADYILVRTEEKETRIFVTKRSVRVKRIGNGKHQIIPYKDGKAGLDTVVWFGEDMDVLFEKSCDTIQKPYHGDENLCEGMTWCWAMISYMVTHNNLRYVKQVKEALEIVMGNSEKLVPRNTIVPYETDGFPAYHIYQSQRIQEQFFGISILTEMYKLTKESVYLNFAVKSAETMIEQYQKENGAFISVSDYTTVCAPMIPIVDLAVLLRNIDIEKSEYFSKSARKIAEYLVGRGMHFPTESIASEWNDEEMEDGSISCTALSVLYYCYHIECVETYIQFAEQVLKFHDWWRSYTPDVRIYMSTMRWWETIWEGDGNGPAICAGHAWSIWRAEADFYMAVLKEEPEYFVKSWDGYMTNFSKITPDGKTYACYQPDYFTGGGDVGTRKELLQLSEEDVAKRYEITHGYPRHFDNSLSRYVWVRTCPTWFKTAVVIQRDDEVIALNCEVFGREIKVSKNVEKVYVFK